MTSGVCIGGVMTLRVVHVILNVALLNRLPSDSVEKAMD